MVSMNKIFSSVFSSVLLLGVFLIMQGCGDSKAPAEKEIIHTVTGPIGIEELGFTLTHEHAMSNFGLDISEAHQYDETELFSQVIPYLKKVKSLGVDTIFDCTSPYFGRRVDLLQQMADLTGLQIITNTGIYGAADNRYVPEYAFEASAVELASMWTKEFDEGIDGTDIKPGFVKLAFNEGTPSEIEKKLFEAGVLTHLQTGLTLAVHTGNNPEAVETQLRILEEHGVSPEAWVWVHAHWDADIDLLIETALKGAWISLDGANEGNIEEFLEYLERFRSENLLHRVLLSHDGDAYPAGGEIRPFDAIPKYLIPAMRERGFTDSEIDQIMIENPKKAFMPRIRRSE